MVLSGVYLIDNPAQSGFVWPDDNEQIFTKKSDGVVGVDDFHVRQILLVRAHFILTLDDKYPSLL